MNNYPDAVEIAAEALVPTLGPSHYGYRRKSADEVLAALLKDSDAVMLWAEKCENPKCKDGRTEYLRPGAKDLLFGLEPCPSCQGNPLTYRVAGLTQAGNATMEAVLGPIAKDLWRRITPPKEDTP